MVNCCILGCKSRSERKSAKITFHRFPSEPNLMRLWTQRTGRKNWHPNQYSRVCSKHFEKICFYRKLNRKYMYFEAVPTIQCHDASTVKANMSTDDEDYPPATAEEPIECRICLSYIKPNSQAFDLFQTWDPPWDGMECSIAEDLNRLTNIQVKKDDSLSKNVCKPCCDSLKQACSFVKLVTKNNSILKQRQCSLKPLNTTIASDWPQPIKLDMNMGRGVYDNPMGMEIKQEIPSDDENDLRHENSEVVDYNQVEIKVEPEEMSGLQVPVNGLFLSNNKQPKEELKSNGSLNEFESEYLEEEYLDASVKAEPLSEEEVDSFRDRLLSGENYNSISSPKGSDKIIKEEPLSEEEGGVSHADLSLVCLLCSKHLNCISGLKAHVIANHSYKSIRRAINGTSPLKVTRNNKCETCKRTFLTPTDLMVHETCHKNVVCFMCNQKFDEFHELAKHRKECKAMDKS